MLLSYFKEESYDKLLGAIENNLDWYNSAESELSDIGIDESSVEMSQTVNLPSFSLYPPLPNASNEEKSENDLINIKIVFDNWKALAPLQAHNRYLWTYYCHCDQNIRSYIQARWGNEPFTSSQVKELFFVTGTKRNLVRGNALSSLWWKGYLTYDEDNTNDHFWLTRTIGTTTNLADYLDTYNSFNPKRSKGMLRAINKIMDEHGMDTLKNKHLRELNKRLNRYAAVSPLDYYSEDDIEHLVSNELTRILEA